MKSYSLKQNNWSLLYIFLFYYKLKSNNPPRCGAKILEALFIFLMSFKLGSFIILKDKISSTLRKIIQDKMYCNIMLL